MAAIEIYLKVNDSFFEKYRNNQYNTLSPVALKSALNIQRMCFFQKYPSSDKGSRHRILVPFSSDRAIEFIVYLGSVKIDDFTQKYFYRVQKAKEISLFNPPVNDTESSLVFFNLIAFDDKTGSEKKEFQTLYQTVDAQQIPQADIQREKDIAIWNKYVLALKKLVKEKEQIWKITDVSKPYYSNKTDSDERDSFIDISIDEKELLRNLERNFKALFNKDDIEEYAFEQSKVFIEFNKYTVLDNEMLSRLKTMAQELFYDLKEDTPIHTVSGSFDFSYVDIEDKEEVLNKLSNEFYENYGLQLTILEDNSLKIGDNDEKHLQKFIEDNYHDVLSLDVEKSLELKVEFDEKNDIDFREEQIRRKLIENNLDRARINIQKNDKLLNVTVSSFIRKDFFDELGIRFLKSISRLETTKPVNVKDFPGLVEVDNIYHYENANKLDLDRLDKIAATKYPDLYFKRLATRYVFKYSEGKNFSELREFKTLTDLPGKSFFNVHLSKVKLTVDSEKDYQNQVERIRATAPFAKIENKGYVRRLKLNFICDNEEHREHILNKVQNELRQIISDGIACQTIRKHTSLIYAKNFTSEDERDVILDNLKKFAEKYEGVLDLFVDSRLGTTKYEFLKNENLEAESEKERFKEVKFQSFVFLNPDEKQELQANIDKDGIDARFFGGLTMGTLRKKVKNKLTFRITDLFESKLNAKIEERLEIEELKEGFIKPIFPGDLTNIDRMIKAMRKVTAPGGRAGYPVNLNLSNFLFNPKEVVASSSEYAETRSRILQNLNEPLLKNQEKQIEAVTKTLLAKDMALIQGPPGTGKTTVIAEIIWQVLSDNPKAKILITSQTNLAVDNALERLKGKKLVRPIRIGRNEKFEDEGKVYSFDRINEWNTAKSNSIDETYAADNAVNNWIENVSKSCSDDPKFSKAVKKWKEVLENREPVIKSSFRENYIRNINVFAATCSECGSGRFAEAYRTAVAGDSEAPLEPMFDLVIMDEASKATPPELVLPLTFGKKVVIIGDHKQLPPMLDEKEFSEALENLGARELIEDWTTADYKTSQFEKLFKNAPKSIVASLDTQFRMHEQIMNCISQFYEDQEELENGLICGIKNEMDIPDFANKASRWHGLTVTPLISPKNHAIWVNVNSEENRVGTSFENQGEVNAVKTVLKALTQAQGFDEYLKNCKKEEDKEIGIITYYMPQMQAIKNSIYENLNKNQLSNFEHFKSENEFYLPFRINTVDRFQGMERNIVIISTVRSNRQIVREKNQDVIRPNYALGFAKELQRINVGFSRAKRLLIVIGNEKHFSQKAEYEKAISKMHKIDISQLENVLL